MKRVISISLGSSKRDSTSEVEILGERFEVSRIGTGGDMARYAEMIRELDGKVDAIGLGGIDRYYWVDAKRYTVRDADRLARNAKVTPVVDGSGVKNTLERRTIQYLQDNGIVDFGRKKVLLVAAVDRFGMAQTIDKLAGQVIYGDLMFTMGIPIPMRSYATVRVIGSLLLPVIVKLPFKWFYPTGSKQEKTEPKHQKYYKWADVIAGDYHLIRKTMPTAESGLLRGKTLVTNTLTAADTEMLADRGLGMLVTAMPEQMKSPDGRHYATNVFEGVLITLLGKRPEDVTAEDYEGLLARMEWKPTVAFGAKSSPEVS
jgi:hypothetical protein